MTDRDHIFYPQYCFSLSPTFTEWCFIQAADIDLLTQPPQYEGQPIFFYQNLPIRWVRLVGLIVIVDVTKTRLIISLDDGSGRLQRCLLWHDDEVPQNNTGKPDSSMIKWPAELRAGAVVEIKGELSVYQGSRQLKISKFKGVVDTTAELKLWEKREKFRGNILRRASWVLSDEDIKRAEREAEKMEDRRAEREFEKVMFDGVDWEGVRQLLPEKALQLRRRYLKLVREGRMEEKEEFVRQVSAGVAKRRIDQRRKESRGGGCLV